jgi:protein-tyrosine-phosphatase
MSLKSGYVKYNIAKEMPENAIASVRYRGIPIRAYRAAVLATEAATAAKAIVALYADLVDPM